MRILKIFTALLLLNIPLITSGQDFHIHINNDDKIARQSLNEMNARAGEISTMLNMTNEDLEGIIRELKKSLEIQYKATQFDQKQVDVVNDFPIIGSHNNLLEAINTTLADYLHPVELDYLNSLQIDKDEFKVLSEITIAADEIANNNNRQEMYRLQTEYLKLFIIQDAMIRQKIYDKSSLYNNMDKHRIVLSSYDRKFLLNNPYVKFTNYKSNK